MVDDGVTCLKDWGQDEMGWGGRRFLLSQAPCGLLEKTWDSAPSLPDSELLGVRWGWQRGPYHTKAAASQHTTLL